MNLEQLRDYCLSKKGTSESYPFDDITLVFKVGIEDKAKLFALVNTDNTPFSVNLKCDPERAIELREQYKAIIPGYHMNKKHWNTVDLESDVSDLLIKELIDHSYELIVKSLPKKIQSQL